MESRNRGRRPGWRRRWAASTFEVEHGRRRVWGQPVRRGGGRGEAEGARRRGARMGGARRREKGCMGVDREGRRREQPGAIRRAATGEVWGLTVEPVRRVVSGVGSELARACWGRGGIAPASGRPTRSPGVGGGGGRNSARKRAAYAIVGGGRGRGGIAPASGRPTRSSGVGGGGGGIAPASGRPTRSPEKRPTGAYFSSLMRMFRYHTGAWALP